MKKSAISLLCAVCFAANIWAADVANTDSINIANAKNVKIVERDGKVTLMIEGTEGNPDYTYSRTITPDGASVVKEENRGLGFKIPFVDRDTDSRDVVKSRRSHFDFCMNIGGGTPAAGMHYVSTNSTCLSEYVYGVRVLQSKGYR